MTTMAEQSTAKKPQATGLFAELLTAFDQLATARKTLARMETAQGRPSTTSQDKEVQHDQKNGNS